jgi:polyribonucleotide nucleotidyltransferase
MFQVFRKELMWGGRRLVLETGKIARQADGAVMATYGETTVLCTAVAAKSAKPGQDFFPLTVNYQEKSFAAGKIPGGFFKREGRPSEKETLVSRLIDRPIRPLFVPGFLNETQVICTVLSHDLENDPDIVSMIGASAALTLSGIPFLGPIGGCRIGYINGEYVLNPTLDQMPHSQLDLVVAGTSEGVLMVESEAKELSEETMLGAVMFGHQSFQPVIEAIIELAETCAKEPWTLPEPPANKGEIEVRLRDAVGPQIAAAYRERSKQERSDRLEAAKQAARRDSARRHAHRRARHANGAADRLPGRHPAAGAWLGTVYPRRNAGAGGRDARHRAGRAGDRCAGRRVPRKLHASL